MINFIETVHGGKANRLLQCVLADLKNPKYLSGCRALGLVDKLVTVPLWRKLQESSISIIEMDDLYCMIKEKFDFWSGDAHELVTGNGGLGDQFVTHVDEVWDALFRPCVELESDTIELLQLLFSAFAVVLSLLYSCFRLLKTAKTQKNQCHP